MCLFYFWLINDIIGWDDNQPIGGDTMSNEIKIIQLEEKIKKLEFQQQQLIRIVLHKTPTWAESSLESAKSSGLTDLPYMGIDSEGSYDFYRIIDLLHKKGLI